jgi:hypothetical protein
MFLHKPQILKVPREKNPNGRNISSFNITALTHCVPNDSCFDSAKENMFFSFDWANR